MYPLFRRTAADLQGAALRVHITLTVSSFPGETSAVHDTQVDSDSQGELLSEDVETAHQPTAPTTPQQSKPKHEQSRHRTSPDVTSVPHTELGLDESFPVTVAVDRAMHLNLKGEIIMSN